MKMEHKCEKCNHKQDVEVPNIRQIVSGRWFWFRMRLYRIFRSQLLHKNVLCNSPWCLRAATWVAGHKDDGNSLFLGVFSCDKHLKSLAPDKDAEITSLRNRSYKKDPPTKKERARLRAIHWHSFFRDMAELFREGITHHTCYRDYCFKKAVWYVGYKDVERGHACAEVCATHLKEYDNVWLIRALKDFG